MEKKVKRKSVSFLYSKITDQQAMMLKSKKVSYARGRTEDRLVSILKEQEAFNKKEIAKRGPVPEEFIKEEEAIIAKHAEKAPDGSYITNGMYNIPNEAAEDFYKEREELYEKFGEQGQKIKEYNKTMDDYFNEEIIIEFYMVKEEDLPDDINSIQRKVLSDIITE